MIAQTLISLPLFRSPSGRFLRCAGLCRRFALVAAVTAAALGGFEVSVSHAQDRDLKSLLDRIDRLQKEMTTLQRHVYRGEEPPPDLAPASPSQSSLSDTQAARIEVRLTQFEAEIRTLTGKIEEQDFRIDQFAKRLDKLVVDVDERLQRVERALAGGAVAAAPAGGEGESGQDEEASAAARGEGVIGQISAEQPAGGETPVQSAKLAADATPEEQYDYAFGLLSRNDFAGAEEVLSRFLERYPSDKLAGNAKYWLGETYYVRGRYAEAAITFAEGYETYPDSVKAPDNLLKLGKSLAALGQTEDACGTFAELHKRYGSASSTILQQAKNEQKKLSCR